MITLGKYTATMMAAPRQKQKNYDNEASNRKKRKSRLTRIQSVIVLKIQQSQTKKAKS
jgi:hypothetical protein